MITEIDTYADLLKALQQMSESQLQQKVQFAPHNPDETKVTPLQPCIAIGTVDEFGFRYIRSSVDNRRHGDEVVFLTDWNPFEDDGAAAYEMTGEIPVPIYPEWHDDAADWTGPAQRLADQLVQADDGSYRRQGAVAINRL